MPRRAPLRAVVISGALLLATSAMIGIALRDNQVGTDVDRWFQRMTASGAAFPRQPSHDPRVAFVLTVVTSPGHFPGIALYAAIVVMMVAAAGVAAKRDSRGWSWIAVACAPPGAMVVAGLSAEYLLKPVTDRRMLSNLTVLTYPSGHATATAAIAAAGVVGLMVAARASSTAWAERAWKVAAVPVLAVPLVTGVGMAALWAHFLTDVVGGWAWGGGWGLCVSAAVVAVSSRRQGRPTRPAWRRASQGR